LTPLFIKESFASKLTKDYLSCKETKKDIPSLSERKKRKSIARRKVKK